MEYQKDIQRCNHRKEQIQKIQWIEETLVGIADEGLAAMLVRVPQRKLPSSDGLGEIDLLRVGVEVEVAEEESVGGEWTPEKEKRQPEENP